MIYPAKTTQYPLPGSKDSGGQVLQRQASVANIGMDAVPSRIIPGKVIHVPRNVSHRSSETRTRKSDI